jgi:hypothetical protein
MNHHPTPETDANAFPDFERGGDIVLADVARDLERRLAECREALRNLLQDNIDRRWGITGGDTTAMQNAHKTLTKTAPKL